MAPRGIRFVCTIYRLQIPQPSSPLGPLQRGLNENAIEVRLLDVLCQVLEEHKVDLGFLAPAVAACLYRCRSTNPPLLTCWLMAQMLIAPG